MHLIKAHMRRFLNLGSLLVSNFIPARAFHSSSVSKHSSNSKHSNSSINKVPNFQVKIKCLPAVRFNHSMETEWPLKETQDSQIASRATNS